MPSVAWATPDQIDFLEGRLPDFLSAQREKTTPAFWTIIHRDFFARWPDATAEIWPMVVPKKKSTAKKPQDCKDMPMSEWTKLRKNQIINWYNNRGTGSSRRRGKPTIVIGSTGQPPRVPSELNLYSKAHYDEKIRPLVMRVLQNGSVDSKQRLAIINKCTAEAWAGEDEVIKTAIRTEHAQLKLRIKQEPTPEVPSPEECAAAITELPEAVKAFFDEMARRTGWSFTVLGGGRDTSAIGKIRSIAIHVGEDRYQQIFSVANPDFYDHILAPFRSFLYNVYPDDGGEEIIPEKTDTNVHAPENEGLPEPAHAGAQGDQEDSGSSKFPSTSAASGLSGIPGPTAQLNPLSVTSVPSTVPCQIQEPIMQLNPLPSTSATSTVLSQNQESGDSIVPLPMIQPPSSADVGPGASNELDAMFPGLDIGSLTDEQWNSLQEEWTTYSGDLSFLDDLNLTTDTNTDSGFASGAMFGPGGIVINTSIGMDENCGTSTMTAPQNMAEGSGLTDALTATQLSSMPGDNPPLVAHVSAPAVLGTRDGNAAIDNEAPTSISLGSGITDENSDRVTRSRRPAVSKDVPQQLVWLDLASDYLSQGVDDESWKDCIRRWLEFEKKEASELDTSSFRIPAKSRPALLSKWLSGRKYGSIPVLPDKSAFADEWLVWWNTIQPEWRKNPLKNGLPLSLELAKGKDSMLTLRKGGPSGLVTALIGLKWWAGQDERWGPAVNDLLLCIKTFNGSLVKRKRSDGNEQEKGEGKAKSRKLNAV